MVEEKYIGTEMPFLKRHVLAFASLVFSGTALASSHTADFSGVNDPGGTGASFNYSVDGFNITVSAWSDTYNNLSNSDTEIQTADLEKYGSGWGIRNQDEGSGSPGHSADSIGSNGWVDYDMFLIQFNTEVTLTGADFSWLYNVNNSQISAAAIGSNAAANLGGSTWSDVLADAGTLWSGSSNVDSSTYEASVSAGQTASQYWLIGAYNSAFGTVNGGTTGDDGLKLSSISFDKRATPTTEIAEPHSAILMLLGLSGFALRSRRRTK